MVVSIPAAPLPLHELENVELGVEGARFMGDLGLEGDFIGEEIAADTDEERDNPTWSLFDASNRATMTSCACNPRLRTFVAVSLFAPAFPADEDVKEERVGAEEGACALSAERMCAGVTTGAGAFNGLNSGAEEAEAEVDAISIATRRTSNRERTSPVCDAIFFVSSVSVGNGKNFLAAAFSLPSSCPSMKSAFNRLCNMSSNCGGV